MSILYMEAKVIAFFMWPEQQQLSEYAVLEPAAAVPACSPSDSMHAVQFRGDSWKLTLQPPNDPETLD